MFVVEAVPFSRSLNSQPAALPLGECGRTTRLTPLAVKSKEHRANLNTKVTIPPSEFYERVSLVLAGGFGGARVDGRSRRSGVKVGVKTDDIWLESGDLESLASAKRLRGTNLCGNRIVLDEIVS